MEILSVDVIFGDFRASDYGLMLGSFSYSGTSEDGIGIGLSTIEEFIGQSSIPVYIGQKYTDKLKFQITLVKNPQIFQSKNLFFYEKDCRWILRILSGAKGYQWLKFIPQISDEDLSYNARVSNVSYQRVGGNITGIILDIECDSCFAWSKELDITIHTKANQHFSIYNNTDDLHNYVYPTVSILSSSGGTLSMINLSDNNWVSEIKNIAANEGITIDSKHQIISSTLSHELLLDDFNLGWPRLVPNKNKYMTNHDAIISMKFRTPRKVGIVE